MAIVPADGAEQDVAKLWTTVIDLSEQLSKNKTIASFLLSRTSQLKALHCGTGFVLRRFNEHLSEEEFHRELERMTTNLLAENHGLQYDNKQLGSLLKEYEQALESVMNIFRSRAHEVQRNELSLMRHYESMLLVRETASLEEQLVVHNSVSFAIARISQLLRMAVRSMNGEEPQGDSSPSVPNNLQEYESYSDPTDAPMDWALERECELVRLEKENEELRRMLDLVNAKPESRPRSANAAPPRLPNRRQSGRGGFMGRMGDFNTSEDCSSGSHPDVLPG